MPPHESLGLHDDERLAPLVECAREPRAKDAIKAMEPWSCWRGSVQHRELVLQGGGAATSERGKQRREGEAKDQRHERAPALARGVCSHRTYENTWSWADVIREVEAPLFALTKTRAERERDDPFLERIGECEQPLLFVGVEVPGVLKALVLVTVLALDAYTEARIDVRVAVRDGPIEEATGQVAAMLAPYDASMLSTARFIAHSDRINAQRANARLGVLTAGQKKDVVLTKALAHHSGHVAIYGWHLLSGTPIEGLNATSHSATYADYSHGIRLVHGTMTVDRQEVTLADVLNDPALCGLVSDEGVGPFPRY
jgi:hypothetical protein